MARSFLRMMLAGLLGFGLISGRIVDVRNMKTAPVYPISTDPAQPLEPLAQSLGIAWPPSRLRLLALKEERVLEVWIANAQGPFRKLTTYAILAASGTAGPKRQEGDLQVPEGHYRLTTLNPQSRFHLSIRVDYPNAVDRAHSPLSLSEMGGDIYVHGKDVSIGCIAIGDPAIERLYSLISAVPPGSRDILIAPVDLRLRPDFEVPGQESWIGDVYRDLREKMRDLPFDVQYGSPTD